jgi:transglutaminase-like putative cysteine protease
VRAIGLAFAHAERKSFMRFVLTLLAVLVIACFTRASAQQKARTAHDEHLYELARTDLRAFAKEVSKGTSSELGETHAIVLWLTQHFDWKTTDYQERTVQQIVERGGGNCNDLALVALAAMKELNIKVRRVHEVHIRTESIGRGERSCTKLRLGRSGLRCSIS